MNADASADQAPATLLGQYRSDRSDWYLLATPLIPLLTLAPFGGWLMCLVAPITLLPSFIPRVQARDYVGAWVRGMAWASLLSLGVILLVFWLPRTAESGIVNGETYRVEMFEWIATGDAQENRPGEFLAEHGLHLLLFVLLTWLSGGYLGLVLGAALTAYMSYFVGSYAVAAELPIVGSLVAWVPWSVIRVAAFVLLGALFARPLLVRKLWPFERREHKLMAIAMTGILADVTIKTLAAPSYGVFLRNLAGDLLLGGG